MSHKNPDCTGRSFSALVLYGLLLAAWSLLSACGYSLVGGQLKLPKHIQKVSIPIFANKTYEAQIETDLTSAIREEFIVDGRLQVVSQKQADALLIGEIQAYSVTPLAFDARDNVTEYRLNFTILITLQDLIEGKTLFKEALTADHEYRVTSSIADTEARKREAVKAASRDFALELLNLLTEGL
ncbi:MAG: LptE family protein [Candidatus Tectomicrobia bacterium]|uniref:LptE family protein n=1 Tax=Tectimicrobiota bacterium TaxID=2528274 RepID=A0A932FUY8_UNCTE|nr:LptE family protein [Candidatus Tectomicrobia bacterium]